MAFGFQPAWFSRHLFTRKKPSQQRRRDFFQPKLESLEDRRLLDGGGVADPGFPFVDADNDGLFNIDAGDILLVKGELDDGRFDTNRREGTNYLTPIRDAGLVVPESAVLPSVTTWQLKAGGNLVIKGDLSANRDIFFASLGGEVVLDGANVDAGDDLNIIARTDLSVVGGSVINVADDVKLAARCNVHVDEATIAAGDKISIDGRCGMSVAAPSTSIHAETEVSVKSRGDLVVTDATISAERKSVKLASRGDFVANSATIEVPGERGQLTIDARGTADIGGSSLTAGKTVSIQSGKDTLVDGANIDALDSRSKRSIRIKSNGSVVSADRFDAPRIVSAEGHVEVLAKKSIDLDDAEILGGLLIHLNAGDKVSAANATLVAALPPNQEVGKNEKAGGGVLIKAGREIDVSGATIRAWDTHTGSGNAVAVFIKSISSDVSIAGADIGILHGTRLGDIRLDANDTLFVEGSVLTGPQEVIFLRRDLDGEPASQTIGTVDPIYI